MKIVKRALWILMVLSSILFAVVSWRFMFDTKFFEQVSMAHFLENNAIAVYSHFVFGPLALLIGGFQFLDWLRTKLPVLHRAIGWLYVFSCLTGAVGGLFLAVNTQSGLAVAIGFSLLSVAWFYTTLKATVLAAQKQFNEHKKWMVRSFALTLAAITFRVVNLTFMPAIGFSFEFSYSAGSWICWTLNLALAELWLNWRKPVIRTPVTA